MTAARHALVVVVLAVAVFAPYWLTFGIGAGR